MSFIRKNKKGKVKGNPLLDGVSGMLGGILVIKQYKDKVVYSHPPDMSDVKFSEKQKKSQSLFARANAYAKAVIKDPKESAKYAKNLKGKRNVYQAALSEYMRKGKRDNEILHLSTNAHEEPVVSAHKNVFKDC